MRRYLRILALTLSCSFAGRATAAPLAETLAPGNHEANVGDVSLHYVVEGTGPLLFVTSPGWGIGTTYLEKTFKPLEKHLTLIFVNTRGSGGSTRPADPSQMTQAAMADDIDALRAKLGLKKIDLLGHSDGGTVAIEYAERHGANLGRLIVVDGQVLGDEKPDETNSLLKLWADDPHYSAAIWFRNSTEYSQGMSDEQFAHWLAELLPLYFSDPDRFEPSFFEVLKASQLSAWAARTEESAQEKAKRNQLRDATGIDAETLIISGSVDWVVPYQSAQDLHHAIKNSRLSIYANRGHLPWIEDPGRFFSEVAEFELSGRSTASAVVR